MPAALNPDRMRPRVLPRLPHARTDRTELVLATVKVHTRPNVIGSTDASASQIIKITGWPRIRG